MDLSAATAWWIAAVVLVAAEMCTCTFFLLMLALGVAAGALAAHAGLDFMGQGVAAVAVGGGAVALWAWRRSQRPAEVPAGANPAVMLDIGGRVHVSRWQADGSARVSYRGAQWDARWAGTGAPQAGEHLIRAIEGSLLLLERA